jgi:hypothetical protein
MVGFSARGSARGDTVEKLCDQVNERCTEGQDKAWSGRM